MSDKIVKTGTEVAPASDFARKIEAELKRERPAVIDEGACTAQFVIESDVADRALFNCRAPRGHEGAHTNLPLKWKGTCTTTAPGFPVCTLQPGHPGAHQSAGVKFDVPAVIGREEQDIDGLGLSDILEAAGASTAFQQAIAARLTARAPIMQRVQPKRARSLALSFGPTDVPPNSTVTVQVQPQSLFRGEKLINEGDDELFIQGMFVGQRSQLPTFQNPISLKVFSPNALSDGLMLDACDPALSITIQIMNPTKETRKFAMTIVGKTIIM